jgi:hypothetical protein
MRSTGVPGLVWRGTLGALLAVTVRGAGGLPSRADRQEYAPQFAKRVSDRRPDELDE